MLNIDKMQRVLLMGIHFVLAIEATRLWPISPASLTVPQTPTLHDTIEFHNFTHCTHVIFVRSAKSFHNNKREASKEELGAPSRSGS